MSKTISAASYSRASVFAQCKFRAKLAFIDKIPEPDRGPPPKGKKEWANDRGSRIHDEAEQYVKSESEYFPVECKDFKHELNKLREMYKAGNATNAHPSVITEQTWCFDEEWGAVSGKIYEEIKLRIICDVTIFLSDTEGVIIDYKTGQKYGNEVSHSQQLQLYQVAAFIKYPQLEIIHAEIYYFDQNELVTTPYRRSQGIRFFKHWDDKFKAMLNCTAFPPNANIYSCKWCPYRQDRSGDCGFGVY